MKKLFLVMTGLLLITAAFAQDRVNYRVVPLPESIIMSDKKPFLLNSETVIVVPAGDERLLRDGQFLVEYIGETTGMKLQVVTNSKHKNAIHLNLNKRISNKEGYTIKVSHREVTICGQTPAGVFYGIQTLRKSLPVDQNLMSVELPAVKIVDAPRFAYRGMMLDCVRHFFPVSFIKKFIDLLALHNMNVFHWHLTDDQGWRIEIKKYPRLTLVGSVRSETVIGRNSEVYDGTPYGGFYTQDEAREIVKYAADRYITIIPEIDMPGHVLAALTAYPELGCTGGPYQVLTKWSGGDPLCLGNDTVYTFVKGVIDEIMGLFPSKYIHLGGDEAHTDHWASCPRCQKVMEDNHLTVKTLQGYFTNRVESYVRSKGRVMIGWDEILAGNPNKAAVVMSWRGAAPGAQAAKAGYDVIMSPGSYDYFDHYQTSDTEREPLLIGGYLPVEKVYSFEPFADPADKETNKHIIGVQANLWTEYITCPNLAEYQILPRMAALSEVQWMQPEAKDFEDFRTRSVKMRNLYDAYGLKYAKFLWNGGKK
ncbi:MAG: beta-N-acetylhexosaminidase [Prevotella sp.]|jgi:hexosaminidase|nr:beta-N-acetylhexosaminidase [Prevotella sp.]MCH3970840.1 beta-N-acetylhexosaminidase [Prevotella sp.]MCH3985715.1 beta-N-acetylhexosaminidase [Prevotella sp.]MCH4017886.1 beta-N-acetylhexosaminidase [Prevotella sp.]MCH4186801.1 beta-N-acetylhexosaminidase [Prevotella sp.]MCH4252070.1 beta-N-acetylhexosaminidase [Prevotella sp.]